MAWADAARALIRVWNERLDEHLLEVVASHAAQGAAPVFGKAVRIAFDGIAAHLAAPCDLLLRGCRLLDLDDLVLCRVVAIVVRGGLGGRLAAQHAMVVIVGDGRSLAHDLGHTPFGHAGERALHRIMFDYGGFDHNLQALRIVDELEVKYPEYDGINLTWEVRSGLIKHRINHEGNRAELDGETLPLMPALEAQVADVADDLTYYGHDVDDGLDSGLITPDMLEEVELWRRVSEKAYAYKMRLEALSRQGKRTDLTSDPVGWKSSGKETAQLIGEQSGDSQTQVRRYIRLTNLVPELLEYVDEGRIKMRPAVELSFLDEDSQRDVVDEIDLNDATPSHDQTIRMRKFFEEGKLTTEAIQAIMSEEKPNQREKIVLRGDRVRQLIPKNIPISQTEDFVCKALEHYNKFLRSRADRDSR